MHPQVANISILTVAGIYPVKKYPGTLEQNYLCPTDKALWPGTCSETKVKKTQIAPIHSRIAHQTTQNMALLATHTHPKDQALIELRRPAMRTKQFHLQDITIKGVNKILCHPLSLPHHQKDGGVIKRIIILVSSEKFTEPDHAIQPKQYPSRSDFDDQPTSNCEQQSNTFRHKELLHFLHAIKKPCLLGARQGLVQPNERD
jgi:hypothetical protein